MLLDPITKKAAQDHKYRITKQTLEHFGAANIVRLTTTGFLPHLPGMVTVRVECTKEELRDTVLTETEYMAEKFKAQLESYNAK